MDYTTLIIISFYVIMGLSMLMGFPMLRFRRDAHHWERKYETLLKEVALKNGKKNAHFHRNRRPRRRR